MGVSIQESGGSRGKKSVNLELELIPFIDLLCSLITFLLMTAVWIQVSALELSQGNLQRDPGTPPPEEKVQIDLRVEVDETGFRIVEHNKVEIPVPCTSLPCFDPRSRTVDEFVPGNYDYEALRARLNEEKVKFPDQNTVVVVSADEVPYNEVVHTIDLCLQVGLEGIGLSGTLQ